MRGIAATALAALTLAAAAQSPVPDPVREAYQKCDIPALRRYAESGDLRAIKVLIIAYEVGSCGLKPDPAEAFRWEKLAASKGDQESASHVGFVYLYGEKEPPVARDAKEAARWLGVACEAGRSNACDALSELYMSGATGVPQDPVLGRHCWALARVATELQRAVERARRYSIGYEKPPKDMAEGLERVAAGAAKGTREDIYCLGLFDLYGPFGFPRSTTLGTQKITEAAEKGDWDALLYLGLVFRHGVGFPQDPAQARVWLQKASAAGHPRAQAWLGEMLVDGEGGPRDFAAAEPLLKAAADAREPVSGLLDRLDIEKEYAAAGTRARKPPIGDLLWPTLRDKGARAAEAHYRELLKTQPDAYEFSEVWLNYLGYRMLDAFRPQDAEAVFRLNAQGFPNSWNVWDSLAEAQAALGRVDEAIANYKKSLAMNPENKNAASWVAKLEKEKAEAAARAARPADPSDLDWLLEEYYGNEEDSPPEPGVPAAAPPTAPAKKP